MPVIHHESGKLVSMINLTDIVAHILNSFSEEDLKAHDINNLILKRDEFLKQTVMDVKGKIFYKTMTQIRRKSGSSN